MMKPLALTEEGNRPEGDVSLKPDSRVSCLMRLPPFYFPGTANPFECFSHLSLPQEHVFISSPLDLRLG